MATGDLEPKLKYTKEAQRAGIIAISVVVLALIVYLIIMLIHGGSDLNTTPHGKITYANGIITIENLDDYDWTQIWFSLDTMEKPGAYNYRYQADLIESHQSLQIDITQFQGDSGSNFNPVEVHPKALLFWVITAAGEGKVTYEFN